MPMGDDSVSGNVFLNCIPQGCHIGILAYYFSVISYSQIIIGSIQKLTAINIKQLHSFLFLNLLK